MSSKRYTQAGSGDSEEGEVYLEVHTDSLSKRFAWSEFVATDSWTFVQEEPVGFILFSSSAHWPGLSEML